MTEIKILREYQNSERVQKLIELVNGHNPCATETRTAAIKYLIAISHEAMEKVGIFADQNGQWDFADSVFFDLLMPDADKIYWLKQCDGQDKRIEAIERDMRRQSEVLESEFIKL